MLKKLFLLFFLVGCGLVLLLLTCGDSRFEVTYSQRIAQPVEKVWLLLEDVDGWPQWWPGFEQVKLIGPRQVGSQLELKLEGVMEVAPAILSDFQPKERLAWQQEGFFGSVATTTLALIALDGSTEVTVSHFIEGPQAKLAQFTTREDFTQYQQLFLKTLELHLQQLDGEND